MFVLEENRITVYRKNGSTKVELSRFELRGECNSAVGIELRLSSVVKNNDIGVRSQLLAGIFAVAEDNFITAAAPEEFPRRLEELKKLMDDGFIPRPGEDTDH
jgi:hypothetical protein